ncbi:NB-ARC domain, LRR domain containing protein [Trema orientale]|uniref:NB-ARC domain, LRR domain containing protein n=1 Tax=Trema orientale TaxID=63057 RepID=A0A2P5EJW4_TREOI|nr:NB-ARC domain, LRR domain containing protein [Trema orientale]
MASGTVGKAKEEILQWLVDGNVTTVILTGKHGVGKTTMAREIHNLVEQEGLAYLILWVHLNRKYDERILHEKIAQQLSLFSTAEKLEDDEEEEKLEPLQQKITKKLGELKSPRRGGKKFFLVIADDVPLKLNEEEIMSQLYTLVPWYEQNFFKVLITRRENVQLTTDELKKKHNQNGKTRIYQLNPLDSKESLTLFEERLKTTISGMDFKQLSQAVVEISKGIPAAIITIAEALKYIGQHESGISFLKRVLKEAASDHESAYHLTRLIYYWRDMLPDSMVNCFLHSLQFFRRHGGVHYNELITHWILEGCLGHVDRIQKAYEDGHHVLMELIGRGMLKMHEDDVVVMEGSVLSISDHRCSRLNWIASLGLANVFEDEKWERFGRITPTDGMIKSLCSRKNWEQVSTLLMNGKRLCREDAKTFYQSMQGLQVFAVFNPLFPLPLSKMTKLRVLVLRGCDALENIGDICGLTKLRACELSGAVSLKSIPDLFRDMPDLRSVNLSLPNIKSLPTSLFSRKELRWLILRGCSCLEELQSLEELEKLEVIDLSGAISLKKIEDDNFSSLKKLQMLNLSQSQVDSLPSFHNLGDLTHLLLSGCSYMRRLPSLETIPRLQVLDLFDAGSLEKLEEQSLKKMSELKVLDLSGTAIRQLPAYISKLSHLYLRDCSFLVRLPSTREMKHLQVLDLSGSRDLVEIEDQSFNHLRFLRILKLSKSKLKQLPSLSGLKRLQTLNLSGCMNLVELPHLDALEELEVLDLSGCSSLKVIKDESFEKLSQLQKLDLSETQIEFLPTLCEPSNLSHLLLRSCINLKKLSPGVSLSKLVEIDLSGARSLGEIEAQFLKPMSHLQILDLSGTRLAELQSLSELKKLRQLKLRDCSLLKTLQDLASLKELEILDISGTAVGYLPPLDNCSNLRQLLLKDCSQMEDLLGLGKLSHLEVLDLSGTRMKKFPYEIQELTCLKHLDLPDLKDVNEIDWGKIKHLPEEVNWDQCGITKHDITLGKSDKISMSLRGTKFLKYLEKNPEMLETVFQQFHLFVGPPKEQGEDRTFCLFKGEPFFRDVYFLTRHFPKDNNRFLEVSGSYRLPNGFESILKHTQYLSLIDNDCISFLSDLGAENVPAMRGCWIEKCSEMKSILSGEDAGSRMGRNLEVLWISNVPRLTSLGGGNLQTMDFKNLKHLYLDCCPMIEHVFYSSQMPENLETIHAKFCKRLKTLFRCKTEAGSCTLQKLLTVRLFELPEFESLGMEFPSEKLKLEHGKCPMFMSSNLDG